MEKDHLDPPVSLYVKTHLETGLKYVGITTKDPLIYKGSGLYWLKHVNKHGYNVKTEVIGIYISLSLLEKDCLEFSEKHDIVKSKDWANLMPETGRIGMAPGKRVISDERRVEYSKLFTEMWQDPEYREKVTASRKTQWTPERRENLSQQIKERMTDEERKRRSVQAKENYPNVRDKLIEASRQPMTEEAKEKAREKLRGVPKSDACKEKLSAVAKNRRHPRAPLEAKFISPNSYEVAGIKLYKTQGWKRWTNEDGSLAFRSLKEAVETLMGG